MHLETEYETSSFCLSFTVSIYLYLSLPVSPFPCLFVCLSRPIVCICNDLYARVLRLLRPLCDVIAMGPPPRQGAVARMKKILRDNGLHAEPRVLESLLDIVEGDLRAAINALQLLARYHSPALSLCLSLSLSLSLSFPLSLCLSFSLPLCLSLCLSLSLSLPLSLSVCLSVSLSLCLSLPLFDLLSPVSVVRLSSMLIDVVSVDVCIVVLCMMEAICLSI